MRLHHGLLALLTTVAYAATVAAQPQRPLQTVDPDPIGAGRVLIEAGASYARDAFYPLSGLTGDLWQVPIVGFVIGLSPIADFELSGGPYNQLSITQRTAAPLASLITATGPTTHDVEDVSLGTKIRLAPEGTHRPELAFRFSVRLPNAKHASGLGLDTTDFSAGLLVGKTIGRIRTAGNLGFTIMTEPLDATKQNDLLAYGLSVAGPMHHDVTVVADVNGRFSTRNGVPPIGTENRALATLGLRVAVGAASVDAAIFLGLEPADPSFGVKAGWTYVFKAFALP
jgi:hypothetical protein